MDFHFGRPVCAFLTAARKVSGCFSRRKPYDPSIKKILFVKWIEQGATVLACDALRRAAELVGRENVYFCVFEENRAILDILGLIPPENVISIRANSLGCVIKDALQAIRKIRQLGIDCAVDMELYVRGPAIFTYLTGARKRVGLHRFTAELPYRGDLMTHRVQHNPYLGVATSYRMLVEALLSDPSETPLLKIMPAPCLDPLPTFVASEDKTERVRNLLNGCSGQMKRPVVVLNPNASDIIPLRKWPTDRFIQLGRLLLDTYPGLTLVLTGAPAEEHAVADIARAIGTDRVISVAGKTSMRDLLVLYTLCDVLVTNDSGPGHFATITDIDAVTLFGPETPILYGPVGPRSHVIWKGLACSPCVSAYNHRISPCKNNVCMQSITVEEVLAKVRELLDARLVEELSLADTHQ